ncbi:hypothetical protein AWC01_08720 [Mycobacterium doricum]|uniref:Uncharacterized protein n=1 Tax=Mycolicibacterium doricum TaxID=126673 RepID=A0A1X1TBM6_9MYCO|nr:hypothetical protein AWC01_08720 [Mycolicibacterium doricum]
MVCQQCTASVDLETVIVRPDRERASRQCLNELLVDCGWLPTTWGYYCRQHATAVRNGSIRRR